MLGPNAHPKHWPPPVGQAFGQQPVVRVKEGDGTVVSDGGPVSLFVDGADNPIREASWGAGLSNTSLFSLQLSTHGLSLKDLCAHIPPAGFKNVSAFLGQENNKLYFFLHALRVFNEQARSCTS